VNIGIYLITIGARDAIFRNSKNIEESLDDELMACADRGILML
jgi:hypothetical protein